jgi:hypothetical protein
MSNRLGILLARRAAGEHLTHQERRELDELLVAETWFDYRTDLDMEETVDALWPVAEEFVYEHDRVASTGAALNQSYLESRVGFAHRVLCEIALLPETHPEDGR